MFAEPEASHKLLEKLADTMVRYLEAQAAAGARALMIFDSWACLLGPEQYREFAVPAVRRVIDALRPLDVPLIYFPNQGATLLGTVAECGAASPTADAVVVEHGACVGVGDVEVQRRATDA